MVCGTLRDIRKSFEVVGLFSVQTMEQAGIAPNGYGARSVQPVAPLPYVGGIGLSDSLLEFGNGIHGNARQVISPCMLKKRS